MTFKLNKELKLKTRGMFELVITHVYRVCSSLENCALFAERKRNFSLHIQTKLLYNSFKENKIKLLQKMFFVFIKINVSSSIKENFVFKEAAIQISSKQNRSFRSICCQISFFFAPPQLAHDTPKKQQLYKHFSLRAA